MAKGNMPAVRHLRYEVTNSGTPGTETSHYVDIARDLAAINRRMMPQGRIYHISKITVVSRNTRFNPEGAGEATGFISVSVAPTSWAVVNAAKHGKALFDEMRKKALEASAGSTKNLGRYQDFKIRGLHAGAPSPTFLVPLDNGGNSLQYGEWAYSDYVSPDGTTSTDSYTCHLLGPHAGSAGAYTSVGLVQSYQNTRATVAGDNPRAIQDSDDPLANLFDDGTQNDEIMANIAIDNDFPPYDLDNYGGSSGNMSRPVVVQHGTLGADGRVTLGGFQAVHGLIELEVKSPIANDVYSILVELKSGSFKGIAAEAL